MEQRETMDSLIDGLKSGNVEIRKQAIERAAHSPGDEMVSEQSKDHVPRRVLPF